MKRLLTLIMICILCLGSVLSVYAEEDIPVYEGEGISEEEGHGEAAESESETEKEAPPEIKPDE